MLTCCLARCASRGEEIYKEFEQRYKLQIPPGYGDKNRKKEGFKKYGDGVLWFQVIDYAKAQRKTIILITDDLKDDWWRTEKGETLGPRPELTAEISSKAKVGFYMYNVSQFMKYAQESLGIQVKQQSIDEVRDVEQHLAEVKTRHIMVRCAHCGKDTEFTVDMLEENAEQDTKNQMMVHCVHCGKPNTIMIPDKWSFGSFAL